VVGRPFKSNSFTGMFLGRPIYTNGVLSQHGDSHAGRDWLGAENLFPSTRRPQPKHVCIGPLSFLFIPHLMPLLGSCPFIGVKQPGLKLRCGVEGEEEGSLLGVRKLPLEGKEHKAPLVLTVLACVVL